MNDSYNFCHCGCGQAVGERARYIHGHSSRKSGPQYVVEDRGHATPCWVWQRAIAGGGYASIWIDGRTRRAHRWMYELRHGCSLPSSVHLDHLCRVRHCVNPDHLEPVTNAENVQRGSRAKLSPEAVTDIRQAYEDAGDVTRTAFAKRVAAPYGVTPGCIAFVLNGTTWAA